jgi:hypothetical protein
MNSANSNIMMRHSLGGGLASAAALVSGFHTNTFNAAGLSTATISHANAARIEVNNNYDVLQNYSQLIHAYITENDFLDTLIQTPLAMRALGIRTILEDATQIPLNGHSMTQVFYGLMYRYCYGV